MHRNHFDNEKLLRIFKFFIKFTLFSVPLYLIIVLRLEWAQLERFVAELSFNIIHAIGLSPTIKGLLISIPVQNGSWAAFINWDCTGWKSMLAFFALVMATDYPVRRKLAGLLLIPVIFAINLLRIAFMFFYVRTFDLANYQTVHTIIWSWGLIAAILALWVIWLRYDFTRLLSWKESNRQSKNILRKRKERQRRKRGKK